ncbi:hypothetical protein GCM10009549_23430 [Streptomyces thermoalcalitolerans]|uniref:Uncharacterized protein n=1 Tax=Streptomyces thermoalcalitolerans TaxID=65605 RepID=A0ABN1NLG3_9ACTN
MGVHARPSDPQKVRGKPSGWPEPSCSGHPDGTFLLGLRNVAPRRGQLSSWDATARRASASSTPQLISCSVSTEGDWS